MFSVCHDVVHKKLIEPQYLSVTANALIVRLVSVSLSVCLQESVVQFRCNLRSLLAIWSSCAKRKISPFSRFL